jgi:RNA polymerase sigma factor (TIGR02999 family)
VLVDHARKRRRAKRGGGAKAIEFDVLVRTYDRQALGLLDLDDALGALAKRDERAARVIEMRFFGGLSLPEVADALDVGLRTVERDWAFARAWLHRELS